MKIWNLGLDTVCSQAFTATIHSFAPAARWCWRFGEGNQGGLEYTAMEHPMLRGKNNLSTDVDGTVIIKNRVLQKCTTNLNRNVQRTFTKSWYVYNCISVTWCNISLILLVAGNSLKVWLHMVAYGCMNSYQGKTVAESLKKAETRLKSGQQKSLGESSWSRCVHFDVFGWCCSPHIVPVRSNLQTGATVHCFRGWTQEKADEKEMNIFGCLTKYLIGSY